MERYVGMDVSVQTTSVCVVDESGVVVREGKVESDPEAISYFLAEDERGYRRIGLEAGPLASGSTPSWRSAVCR